MGGHAAHGPESNRQLDPEAPASSQQVIEKFPEDQASNVSDSKKDVHAHSHGMGIGDSAAAQIIGIAILEFGVVLHRYVGPRWNCCVESCD